MFQFTRTPKKKGNGHKDLKDLLKRVEQQEAACDDMEDKVGISKPVKHIHYPRQNGGGPRLGGATIQ